MGSEEALRPPQKVLTMDEALARAKRGEERLIQAKLPTTRNIKRRLAWKRDRGIDTSVEERFCGIDLQ